MIRSMRRSGFSQNRRDVLKAWTGAGAMGHRHGARLAQEVGDKACLLRLAALLALFDRLGRRGLRIVAILLNARTLCFLIIFRLGIQQAGQCDLVVLLLINLAMFFGTKLTVTS